MGKWKSVATITLLILIFFHSYTLLYSRYSRSDNIVKLRKCLKQLLSQLKLLKHRHNNLVARIKESPSDRNEIEKLLADDLGPSEEYELLRRRIHSNTKELWNFVSHVLGNGIDGTLEPNQIQTIIDDLTNRKRFIPLDLSNEEVKLQEKIKLISSLLVTLRQRQSRLISRIIKLPRLSNLINEDLLLDYQGPTEEYKYLRRRIFSNTKELWYYLKHQLEKASHEGLKPDKIKNILEEVAARKRSLLSDQEKLPALDGFQEWRRQEATTVSDLVQRRLFYLQNPSDCRNAKKLLCRHAACGYGCKFHHLMVCLTYAYATRRTLILNSSAIWQYKHRKRRWANTFQPLSQTCTTSYNKTGVPLSVSKKYSKVAFIEWLDYPPAIQPFHLPEDLVHRIARFNGDPTRWWAGQMFKYILKPREHVLKQLWDNIAKITFKPAIVGIHVRRTDKVQEMGLHEIDEYMSHVDDYYKQLELTRAVDIRRVYLATDDATVLKEAVKKYSQYTFYGDYSRALQANTWARSSVVALAGALVDLHMLSLCDYVVLTLSSNFGRIAYSLMQTNRVDATNSFTTLDYISSRYDSHLRVAVMENVGDVNDIVFDVGDLIRVRENFWNGSGGGATVDSKVKGLFPWYKTVEFLECRRFPTYEEVPLYPNSSTIGTDNSLSITRNKY